MILGLRVSIAGAVALSFIVGSSLGTTRSRQAASTIEHESVRARGSIALQKNYVKLGNPRGGASPGVTSRCRQDS